MRPPRPRWPRFGVPACAEVTHPKRVAPHPITQRDPEGIRSNEDRRAAPSPTLPAGPGHRGRARVIGNHPRSLHVTRFPGTSVPVRGYAINSPSANSNPTNAFAGPAAEPYHRPAWSQRIVGADISPRATKPQVTTWSASSPHIPLAYEHTPSPQAVFFTSPIMVPSQS